MNRYQILVGWSPEDEAFVARVPDLPGCTAHGSSEEEAIQQAREAIALYLDDLQETGEPAPLPRDYHLVSA